MSKKRTRRELSMSKHPWRRQCRSHKIHYPSIHEALLAAKRYNTEFGESSRAYDCPHCDGFHLMTDRP